MRQPSAERSSARPCHLGERPVQFVNALVRLHSRHTYSLPRRALRPGPYWDSPRRSGAPASSRRHHVVA